MSGPPEYDTQLLHRTRAKARRELLVDGPFTELLLVRHAQQSFTEEDLAAGGATGSRLSETGERQARLTGAHLAREPIDAVYSSALTRAHRTALCIAEQAGTSLEPVVRDDLREIESRDSVTEPRAEVRARLTAELTRVVESHPGQSVAVASHGGAISAFIASILGVEVDMFFFAAHASISRVRHAEGRWVVHTINEIEHLRQHELVTY